MFADAVELTRAAAREFVCLCQQATAARRRSNAALAGGSTPRRVYELLASPEHRDDVDWLRVEFFWGDERAVKQRLPSEGLNPDAVWLVDRPAAADLTRG